MKAWMLILCVALSTGCAEDEYGPGDYGYHYTDTTPMGIMYRVDPGGVSLDGPTVDAVGIDYIFADAQDCSGFTYDPENILIISTAEDVLPERNQSTLEAVFFSATPVHPAMIVVNSVENDWYLPRMIEHEFYHALHDDKNHTGEIFQRCDWWVRNQP